MTGFFARFIPDFSNRAERLYALKLKEVKFIWTQEHQSAIEYLKEGLSESPIL